MKNFSLEILPVEIAHNILHFLPTPSLLILGQVSTKWKRLTENELLWKEKIQTELTSNPILADEQTFKDYYKKIYQGKCRSPYSGDYTVCYYSGAEFGRYLHEINTNQLSSPNDYLHFACAVGAEIWIANLLKKGALLSYRSLEQVLESGNPEAADLVINSISDEQLNAQWREDNYYDVPIFGARRNATVFHQIVDEEVSDLTDSVVNLNRLLLEKDRIYILPVLHLAAACGDSTKLIQLLQEGEPVNKKDVGQCTALWWALICSQIDCVNILISHGANLTNIAVGKFRSAFMVAIWVKNIEILKLVLKQNINLYEETKDCYFKPTPLTALHKATEYNFLEGLELLFKKGLKVNNAKYPFSPLHIAAREGHLNCAKMLIAQGAIINQTGQWIRNDEDMKDDYVFTFTPLGLAAKNGHFACISLLLIEEADPNIKQKEKCIHRKEVIITTESSILSLFIKYFTNLSNAYDKKNAMFIELCNDTFDLNSGNCPFSKNYLECLEQLLRAGADSNKGTSDGYSVYSVLFILINNSYPHNHKNIEQKLKHYDKFLQKCVELLINYKAEVNLENGCKGHTKTALHVAVEAGKIELVRLLIEQGNADFSIPDAQGNTPLSIATKYCHTEIVDYLIEKGANLSCAKMH